MLTPITKAETISTPNLIAKPRPWRSRLLEDPTADFSVVRRARLSRASISSIGKDLSRSVMPSQASRVNWHFEFTLQGGGTLGWTFYPVKAQKRKPKSMINNVKFWPCIKKTMHFHEAALLLADQRKLVGIHHVRSS